MTFLRAKLFTLCTATAIVLAAPSPTTYATPPIVTLDKGTFIGTSNNGVNAFLGIPFAQPPSVVDVRSALCLLWLTRQFVLFQQSWQPAPPSAPAAFPLHSRHIQRNCVRSFLPSTSSCAGNSEWVTRRDARGPCARGRNPTSERRRL
jgi:hypothetical protein